MDVFENELQMSNEGFAAASLYVSARASTPEIASLPGQILTDGGAELSDVREIERGEYALPNARAFAAVLTVPRAHLAAFPARIDVEVETYPATASSTEVGIRPLESVGNVGRYADAARAVLDELTDAIVRDRAAA